MTDNSALVSVGFGNIVSGARIIAVVTPDSAPVKRLIQDARERRLLIDARRAPYSSWTADMSFCPHCSRKPSREG